MKLSIKGISKTITKQMLGQKNFFVPLTRFLELHFVQMQCARRYKIQDTKLKMCNEKLRMTEQKRYGITIRLAIFIQFFFSRLFVHITNLHIFPKKVFAMVALFFSILLSISYSVLVIFPLLFICNALKS